MTEENRREKKRVYNKKWREANKGYDKIHYHANKLVYQKLARDKYHRNRDKAVARGKKYNKDNPDKAPARVRKWIHNLRDGYVKTVLVSAGLAVTPEMIELKRMHLKIYRLMKELN